MSSQKASKHKQVQAYRLLPLNKTRNVPFQTRRIQVVTFNVGSSLLSSIYWPMHQGVVATDSNVKQRKKGNEDPVSQERLICQDSSRLALIK